MVDSVMGWCQMPRGQNFTSEHQKMARSHVKTESLQASGRAGYKALCKKGKQHLAGQKAAQWRLKNPTCLERMVIECLDALPIRYEREVEIGGFYADFLIEKLVIEVNGAQWHEKEELRTGQKEHDGRKYQTFTKLGYTILVLPECDIKSGEAKVKIQNLLKSRANELDF